MISQNIYKEILREYEELTDDAKKKIELKKEICYKKCPRIREIDEQLNMTGIKISKAIIYAGREDKKKYIQDIKDLTEALKNEKEKLMLENGFSKNYFDDVYVCNKCNDTGFINNEKCECFKQKIINKAYDMSNIAEILKSEKFPEFNLDYYSKQVDPKINKSPYENMKLIMRKCSLFIENFDEKFKNMVFFGEPGLGKTHLCRYIARELLNRGKTVLYITAFSLFDMLEKEKFNKDSEEIDKEKLNFIKTADLLIIDDLGTEFITSFSTAELFDIINSRILTQKATIISTNLDREKLTAQYSSRILSRLYGEYDMLEFFGNDIRIQKKLKNKV